MYVKKTKTAVEKIAKFHRYESILLGIVTAAADFLLGEKSECYIGKKRAYLGQ